MQIKLTKADIHKLFALLDEELREADSRAELFVVVGAVMCLAFAARPSTNDVDALFRPTAQVRAAAARVAVRANVTADWLNDGVKGVHAQGEFAPFLELDHLKVMLAQPAYLLAVKCLALRIGEGSHDEYDIRYLVRHLNLRTVKAATEIITKFYPIERFPQKTLHALEELLPALV